MGNNNCCQNIDNCSYPDDSACDITATAGNITGKMAMRNTRLPPEQIGR